MTQPLVKTAGALLCAIFVAIAPSSASARWRTHYGAGHRTRAYDAGMRLPRLSRYPRLVGLPRPPCVPGQRDARGRLKRCAAAKAAFEREHPCPSTGLSRGRCPGYVVDHIIALKRGGADDPSNMQWQTVEEAKAKDRVE